MASSASSVFAEDPERHAKYPSLRPPHRCFKRAAVSHENAIHALRIIFVPHGLFWLFAPLHAQDIDRTRAQKRFNDLDTYREMRRGVPFAG